VLPRTPAALAAAAVALAAASSVAIASPTAPSRAGARDAVRALPTLDSELIGRINAARAAHGLPRLRPSARLRAAASSHSREMLQRGYFDHASADGTSVVRRIKRYYRSATSAVGEALLWWSPDVDAVYAVQQWLSDPPHRAVLLDPAFREIGVSAVHATAAGGTFGGAPATVITADFGARSR
jgi:uncharacterized protein YkwD